MMGAETPACKQKLLRREASGSKSPARLLSSSFRCAAECEYGHNLCCCCRLSQRQQTHLQTQYTGVVGGTFSNRLEPANCCTYEACINAFTAYAVRRTCVSQNNSGCEQTNLPNPPKLGTLAGCSTSVIS